MRPSSSSHDSSNDDCELRKARKRVGKATRSADIERRRNLDINSALEKLQDIIPVIQHHDKLSKIKRLRVAIRYIEYLARILDSDENSPPPSYQEFQSLVMQELQTRNSYVERAEEEREQEEHLGNFAPLPLDDSRSPPLPPVALHAVHNFPHLCPSTAYGYPSQPFK
ncbi:hypothetical protein QR680_009762 [Steinernema hermaphroditum]|uniref:BHLH domain-containing protein n=1 Tax=Steinernema hermaphroditum TaxID=289476 RepID=A0AA39INA8_9BILA|nr:hypothetical protein QR680_009762 [Steinernema hermaphroditum]